MTVLVAHDHGCGWARIETEAEFSAEGRVVGGKLGYSHTDAAKRFSDTYNLHHAAGVSSGWIAIAYADGSGGQDVFDTREEAVEHMWPHDDRYFYCTLAAAPTLSICAAESLLRYKRIMSEVEKPERGAPHGGLEVVQFLTAEDRAEQVRAATTGKGLLTLAHRLHGDRKD